MGGYLLILFDELLQKGYGVGSGVSMFMCTNVCREILWAGFSPKQLRAGEENGVVNIEYEGALFCFFNNLFMKPNKLSGVLSALGRSHGPNIW